MERKRLLYLLSSDDRVSPFDINMAYDAGFDAVVPYAPVGVEDVQGLVQDIMFSRGGKGARLSSVFFSGSSLAASEGMLKAARASLFPPFLLGLMIDPKGAYTTAAALVARVTALHRKQGTVDGAPFRALVLAGTGGVGRAAAALLARQGASVAITSRSASSAEAAVLEIETLFGVRIEARAAPDEAGRMALAAGSDVILSAGAAGVALLSKASIAALRGSKILADVNAVPPHGLEGVRPQDDGTEVAGRVLAVGAMAIGETKFRVESTLLKDLLTAPTPPVLDLEAARRRAIEILESR